MWPCGLLLPEKRFRQRPDQWFVCNRFEDTSGEVVVVMKNIFQPLKPLFGLGFQIALVETDKCKMRCFANFEAMAVLGEHQEEFVRTIRQLVVIDDLQTAPFQNINHFEKGVFVLLTRVLIDHEQLNLVRFMEVLNSHPL